MDNFYTIIIAAPASYFIASIAAAVLHRRALRDVKYANATELQKLSLGLQFALLPTVVSLITLWFLLPRTPPLSTFGRPESITDIEKPEQILYYLQKYNDALVGSIEVTHWMIFIICFLTGGHIFATLKKASTPTPAKTGA